MLLLGADPQSKTLLEGLFSLWPLWLPLVAGAFAIFWLLPRPRAYPWVVGALIGIVALVLGGIFLVRPGPLSTETAPGTILFYFFSASAIASGALLVTQHNPARAALSFALVVLSTCGLFLLLAAPFLMAATIIVYAGAIIVTFLFVLMLAQQHGRSDADDRSREPLLATITGFVLLGALLYVLKVGYDASELDGLLARVHQAVEEDDAKKLQETVSPKGEDNLFDRTMALMKSYGWDDLAAQTERIQTEDWMFASPDDPETQHKALAKLEPVLLEARDRLPERLGIVPMPSQTVGPDNPARQGVVLSNMSGTPANTPPAEIRRDKATRLPQLPAENSAYLGKALFTDFLLPVELAGTLLLVAAIGAIAIGQRRETPTTGRQS
jgi:NADH:ubiquinone oxidoreductase subunit 6 (subunit J)